MPERKITVENTTEHPFDFVIHGTGVGYGYVRVPPAKMDPPTNNQVGVRRNGSAEVTEMLLARLVRERVVRGWFESRECILIGTTVDALMAIELPPEPKAAVPQASGAQDNARLVAENAALLARVAALESGQAKAPEEKKGK